MSLSEVAFDADLLILGGGCAGLSLATRLAMQASLLSVIVIEPRTCYLEDRTWCGWRIAEHPYVHCAAASWPEWTLKQGSDRIVRTSKLYPYEMISAASFYEYSSSQIQASDNVSLAMGKSVNALCEDNNGVVASLADGGRLRTRWVVDTRPSVQTLQFPSLWQNFVGYEIQADPSWTARIGKSPVLMDFQPAGSAVLQFMYLLPLGGHRFLCEWTRFSSNHGEQDEIESALHGWLRTQGDKPFMLCRRESGSLPMSIAPCANAKSRIVPAGTLGGSMRASTGYAFHAIQRWADRCAAALAAGRRPVAPQRNATLDFLDEVFLTALQEPDVRADAVFMQLFRRTHPDKLVRFLSGSPGPSDTLSIMGSLPWIPFSKAAVKTMLRRATC